MLILLQLLELQKSLLLDLELVYALVEDFCVLAHGPAIVGQRD